MTKIAIHPGTEIGHVHLKVSDLDVSVKFYTQVLGFRVNDKVDGAAFLSANQEEHHQIALNTWYSKNGTPPSVHNTGLFHFAIRLPNRRELARVFKCLIDHQWPIAGATNHGVSESIYFQDPDGNGVEIYSDIPRDQWTKDSNGKLNIQPKHLDIDGLMSELKQ